MNYWLALIGSVCFAVCGVPAAVDAWKRGTCNYPWLFLALWALGEVLYIVYMVNTQQWVFLLNYVPNLLCLLVMIRFNRRIV